MRHEALIRPTSDGYEAVHERRLAHPPPRVWSMLTEPEQIQRWYVRTELEPRVGGRITEHHDHVGMSTSGDILRYGPPRVFEHTWWEDIIRWELVPENTGTRLVLIHRFQRLEGAHQGMAGWHILMDILQDVLDGADPATHGVPRGQFENGAFVLTEEGRGRWRDIQQIEAAYAAAVARFAP